MPQHKLFVVYPATATLGTITCHVPIMDKLRGMFGDQAPRNEFIVEGGVVAHYFGGDKYNARATEMLKPQLEAEFPHDEREREIRGSVVFLETERTEASTAWFAAVAESERARGGVKRPPAAKTAEMLYVQDQRKKHAGNLGPNANNLYKKQFQALSPEKKQKWQDLHEQERAKYLSKLSELKAPSSKPSKPKRAHNLYEANCRANPDDVNAPPWKTLSEEVKQHWRNKAQELDAERSRELKAKIKQGPPGGPATSSPKRAREDEPARNLVFEDVKPAKKPARKSPAVEDSSDSNSESESEAEA